MFSTLDRPHLQGGISHATGEGKELASLVRRNPPGGPPRPRNYLTWFVAYY